MRETPLVGFASGDERIELRLKLENQQVIGAFKARGAWNQISQLSEAQRAAGVVATSSGNHATALAWAAARAGVPCTVFMPADAYPNKIESCRSHGARLELKQGREAAEAGCAEAVAAGATLIHPYDARATIEGAGTVGLEIARQWPQVEVCVFPVGGGGLIAGSSLALRRELGGAVRVIGVEPAGAASMKLGLKAGHQVALEQITTAVQGLCPIDSGVRNIDICAHTVDAMLTLEDATIFAAQRHLIVEGGWTVEPAGAAAAAAVFYGALSAAPEGRTAADPLRVVAVISGGNADPSQVERLLGATEHPG